MKLVQIRSRGHVAQVNSNSQQRIPPLFQEIIRNDNQRAALKALPLVNLAFYKGLKDERGIYTKAAELALAWNHNKGNTC